MGKYYKKPLIQEKIKEGKIPPKRRDGGRRDGRRGPRGGRTSGWYAQVLPR